MTIPWLPPGEPFHFPNPESALEEPSGLLAAGGGLELGRLIEAYKRGIFPWYSRGEPILWWSPDPRMVLHPSNIRISRSLRKTLRNRGFSVSHDRDFPKVMNACANTPRPGQDGTWISDEMLSAYTELHHRGIAHSVEVWRNQKLVGGLYGISLGRIFFGESMFSLERDASKVALVALSRELTAARFELIDCQVYTDHLASLGAQLIPRKLFTDKVLRGVEAPSRPSPWAEDWAEDPASGLSGNKA